MSEQLKNNTENYAEDPTGLEALATEDWENHKQEANQRIAEAKARHEDKIPSTQHETIMEGTIGVVFVSPRTSELDDKIMKKQIKAFNKGKPFPFSFPDSSAQTFEEQRRDPDSAINKSLRSKQEEIDSILSDARAHLEKYIESGFAGKNRTFHLEQVEADFSRLSGITDKYNTLIKGMILNLNEDYITAKKEAAKKLGLTNSDEYKALENFDVRESLEQERKGARRETIEPSSAA